VEKHETKSQVLAPVAVPHDAVPTSNPSRPTIIAVLEDSKVSTLPAKSGKPIPSKKEKRQVKPVVEAPVEIQESKTIPPTLSESDRVALEKQEFLETKYREEAQCELVKMTPFESVADLSWLFPQADPFTVEVADDLRPEHFKVIVAYLYQHCDRGKVNLSAEHQDILGAMLATHHYRLSKTISTMRTEGCRTVRALLKKFPSHPYILLYEQIKWARGAVTSKTLTLPPYASLACVRTVDFRN